jgi:hypothetical protein
MNPEDRALLERALKLSEDNNIILKKMENHAKWGKIWGFVKVVLFVLPFIVGYLYLAPLLGPSLKNFGQNYSAIQDLLQQ